MWCVAASPAFFSFRENGCRLEGRNDAGVRSPLSAVGVGAFRFAQRHPTRPLMPSNARGGDPQTLGCY